MDPITHAALGAASAQLLFGKYNKHIPWQAGALAAMAPDLDILFAYSQNPLSLEYWHRHFTHSLCFIPIGAMIVTLFLICFPHFRRHWKITMGSCLIAYATHSLLDALTSYGTLLLWPWSDTRFSWDVIAIIDPLFTVPLVIGTAWSIIFHQSKAILMVFAFCAALLLLNTIQHQRALDAIEEYAYQNDLKIKAVRVMPELASSTQWRAIIKQHQCSTIAEIATPLWGKSKVSARGNFPNLSDKYLPNNRSKEQEEGLEIFSWFADQQVLIANTNPLILADGRYTVGDNPIYSLWGIQLLPKQTQVQKIQLPKLYLNCDQYK